MATTIPEEDLQMIITITEIAEHFGMTDRDGFIEALTQTLTTAKTEHDEPTTE